MESSKEQSQRQRPTVHLESKKEHHLESPEEWNYEDDDCDGYEDIDGIHSGSLSLQAVGIYEGDAYSFEQECTGTTERVEGHLSVSLSCTIDHSQELASLLLGGELEILTEADFVLEEQYSGNALFVSSGGDMEWDSMGSVSLSWSSLEDTGGNSINVYAVLDALYLDVQILGILYRE